MCENNEKNIPACSQEDDKGVAPPPAPSEQNPPLPTPTTGPADNPVVTKEPYVPTLLLSFERRITWKLRQLRRDCQARLARMETLRQEDEPVFELLKRRDFVALVGRALDNPADKKGGGRITKQEEETVERRLVRILELRSLRRNRLLGQNKIAAELIQQLQTYPPGTPAEFSEVVSASKKRMKEYRCQQSDPVLAEQVLQAMKSAEALRPQEPETMSHTSPDDADAHGLKSPDAPRQKHPEISVSTLLTWVRDYENNEQGKCPVDKRGKHHRFSLFDDEGLKQEFRDLLRACVSSDAEKVSVELIREHIDAWLDGKPNGADLRRRARLSNKVGRTTVKGWLSQFGCVYKRKGSSFYVDGHDKPEVKKARRQP